MINTQYLSQVVGFTPILTKKFQISESGFCKLYPTSTQGYSMGCEEVNIALTTSIALLEHEKRELKVDNLKEVGMPFGKVFNTKNCLLC